ncbi:MAG: TrkH family potassium uptake protein [Clostridia bacterium]|nr:TrkH family potassium uptake protein [Clostridia bacterium]
MNFKMIGYLTAKIMLIGAAMLVPPLIVSFIYHDGCHIPFLITIAVFLLLSIPGFIKPKKTHMFAKDGLMIVVLAWIVFSAVGALPFYLSREIPSYIDCLFETVSGFTTTGSSILTEVEHISKSLLFWRSFTHWIGGMGVLVFAMAIFSGKDAKTTHIMRAEMPGPTLGKLASKWQFSVRILYGMYAFLTFVEFIMLLFGGMNVFDSLVHSFGTAGTGGFSVKNISIGYYKSPYIQYTIAVFMMLFGINFNIYYLLLVKKFQKVKANSELKTYLTIIVVATVVIMLNIYKIYNGFEMALRQAFFQVASTVTTTGYATANFDLWPQLSRTIIFILMFVGGCAGSTGGGLKVLRVSVLVKSALSAVRKSVSPKRVLTIKNDGRTIDGNEVEGVVTYFVCYVVFMFASLIVLSLDSIDLETALTAVVTTINNIGPGLGKMIGPAGNFHDMSVLSKIVLSIDMLAGRLELYPVLMLFMPEIWKR